MKKFLILLMVLAAGFTLDASIARGQAASGGSSASGQSGATPRHRGAHTMIGAAPSPQAFVTRAAADSQFEVELGRLAQDKGTDPQVKDLGKMLVDDHTKVNQQLQSVAQKNQIQLTTTQQQISPKDQKRLEHFRSLSGAEFDHAFVAEVIKDHKEDIKLYEREANKGENADVKNFAQTTLTGLREHLKHAQGVEASLKGTSHGGATHHQHGGTPGGTTGGTTGGSTGGATGGPAGGTTGGPMTGSSGGAAGGSTGGTTR